MTTMLSNFPALYRNIAEIKVLSDIMDNMLSTLKTELERMKRNQFIQTTDTSGILMFEKPLEIVPMPDIPLAVRQKRVIDNIAPVTMYNDAALTAKLDAFLGVDEYQIDISYPYITLYVTNLNPTMRNDINRLMANMVPVTIKCLIVNDIT